MARIHMDCHATHNNENHKILTHEDMERHVLTCVEKNKNRKYATIRIYRRTNIKDGKKATETLQG